MLYCVVALQHLLILTLFSIDLINYRKFSFCHCFILIPRQQGHGNTSERVKLRFQKNTLHFRTKNEISVLLLDFSPMLRTTVAGIDIECCLYNASGPRTGSVEALSKIADSRSGAILSKSATLTKQDGNALPRFINKVDLGDYCAGSLNSEGLPNAGIDYCKKAIFELCFLPILFSLTMISIIRHLP